jgi:hypothetical protein
MLALNAATNPVINSNIGNPPVPPPVLGSSTAPAFQDGFVASGKWFRSTVRGGSTTVSNLSARVRSACYNKITGPKPRLGGSYFDTGGQLAGGIILFPRPSSTERETKNCARSPSPGKPPTDRQRRRNQTPEPPGLCKAIASAALPAAGGYCASAEIGAGGLVAVVVTVSQPPTTAGPRDARVPNI